METQFDRVKKLFLDNPERWYNSGETISTLAPQGVKSTAVYVYLSQLHKTGFLERSTIREGAAGFQYRLKTSNIAKLRTATSYAPPQAKSEPPQAAPAPVQSAPQSPTAVEDDKRSRIQWTTEEREKLAREVAILKQTDKLNSTTYLIEVAQKKVFDPSRQRPIRYASDISWIFDLLPKYKDAKVEPQKPAEPEAQKPAESAAPNAEVADFGEKLNAALKPEPQETTEPQAAAAPQEPVPPTRLEQAADAEAQKPGVGTTLEQAQQYGAILDDVVSGKKVTVDPTYLKQLETEAAALKAQLGELQNRPPVAPSVQTVIGDIGLYTLLGEVANRLGTALSGILVSALSTPELRQALTVTINHQHHHLHEHTGEKPPTAEEKIDMERRAENRPPRPKIGVVSGRTDMEPQLRQAFPHINFVVTDREYSTAADKVRNCDRVLVMTKFIGHPTDGAVKKAVGDRYIAVNGGTAEMIRIINMLMSSGQIPKS